MKTVASFEDTIKQDENIGPVVVEVERTLCFTDVPCGAMKFDENAASQVDDKDEPLLARFCGDFERAFCFSNLKDIEEKDVERLRSLKSLQDADMSAAVKEEHPVNESTDTESMSSDENTKAKPTLEAQAGDSPAVKRVKEAVATASTNEAAKNSLSPKNVFQSSKHASKKSGKPMNAMQASKAAKKAAKEAEKSAKKENKSGNKKWSLFRRSSQKGSI